MENNIINLTNRDYSRQSHLIVNSKYAMSSNEINIVLVLLTEIDKNDEDFVSPINSMEPSLSEA